MAGWGLYWIWPVFLNWKTGSNLASDMMAALHGKICFPLGSQVAKGAVPRSAAQSRRKFIRVFGDGTMLKHLSLGLKMGCGFGLILLLSALAGGVVLWNLRSVRGQATILSQEYLPEVKVLTGLERQSLETMYQVRGYAFSEQNSFLEKGRQSLADVKKLLQEARNLAANSTHLVKLKEEAPRLEAQVLEYERALNDTAAQVAKIKQIRKSMDEAAKNFISNIEGYIKGQNEALSKEIKAGAEAAKLAERAQKSVLANEILNLGNAIRIANFKAQTLDDQRVVQAALGDFEEIQHRVSALLPISHSEGFKKQLAEVGASAQAYKKAIHDMVLTWQEMTKIFKKRQASAQQVLGDAKAAANKGMEGVVQDTNNTVSSLGTASNILLFGLVLILVVGIALAFFLTQGITKTVNRISGSLSDGSDQVASAATEVSSASQSLAKGSSEQAASLEETSASLEEMASMTRTNADNARQADALMGETSKVVDNANQSMGDLTHSMREVSSASEETAKIIKTIDEIAFQTNLLALNAAVEAARAGEAGAGFAVVADEVRALAMRAAEAAKNTASLIEGTVGKVKEGSDLVSKAAEAFSQVAGSTGKVKELVAEIAAASDEQAQGVEQINKAVSEMNNVTQQAAANAEESASAAEELTAQSAQMKGVVGELVALVRGVTANGHPPRSARPVGALQTRLETMRQTLGRVRGQAASRSLTPEQIIPLEDDNFKDF
jgi:methyl-accepting chemotaxis protein